MKFQVGGQTWVLEFVPADHPGLDGCGGMTYPQEQLIFVSTAGSVGNRLEIACHEIQHAINSSYTLPCDPTTGAAVPGMDEEAVALVAGKGWAEMFIRNPRLIQMLTDLGKKAR